MPTTTAPVQTRVAAYSDAAAIIAMDDSPRNRQARTNFIHHAITSRSCYVAAAGTQVVAYGMLQYTFFNHGFIPVLVVHRDHRRVGVGSWLMRFMEQACKTPRLFVAIGDSNFPAKAFLTKLGFAPSGAIENLDEPEPQVVFFKKVR